MTETDIQRQLQLAASAAGHRLWRNNSGQGWVGEFVSLREGRLILAKARPLHAGLATGSSDLIGLTSEGRFLSVEVKTSRGRLTDEQRAWLAMVGSLGGVGGVARSVDDLPRILAGERLT